MRGRRPKPTHLKLIGGNAGRRPLNEREPKPNVGMPSPPGVLSGPAKAEWKRVSPQLQAAGLLTKLDRVALAAYCEAYSCWVQAQRAIAKMAVNDPVTGGLLIKTSNGNAIQNPLVGIRNKAQSDMVRYAAEFGLTPSARSRVKAEQGAKPEDIARKYF